MAAALDAAAGTLLTVFEAARERTTSRLSGAQLRAVMVVEQHDGINLRRLATLLDMLLSSASRLCDRLVAAGMLEREPGRSDRREISLHLTQEAEKLLAELRADRRQRLAAILSGMTPEGRQALLGGLQEFDEVARLRHPPEPPTAELAAEARPDEWTPPPGQGWPAGEHPAGWATGGVPRGRPATDSAPGGWPGDATAGGGWSAGDPQVARTA
ncbi:MarR family winged helix-turn-helix transcriptional regulator [Micromonospora sp. PTRAS2]|uniref:MarR family winged helix-turn-helix transcriptional regulator n=1 Tax=Micromonospora TaxID=1873 RepID=UPI00098D0575|nr:MULTISPECIES: MarR family transcriptional regulator [unclassified Micromonospora]OON29302.1 MarR family transcriptional regulator [Micromonospora sp. Rc5]